MSNSTQTSKELVDSYYRLARENRLTEFAPKVSPDFILTVPGFVPWGGTHDAEFFVGMLPNMHETYDFSRFRYDAFFAEGKDVLAFISIGIAGTPALVQIAEHWTVTNGQAHSLRIAYFEPGELLETVANRAN